MPWFRRSKRSVLGQKADGGVQAPTRADPPDSAGQSDLTGSGRPVAKKKAAKKAPAKKLAEATGAAVDAVLVLCVHDAQVPVRPAGGAALKKLAAKALANEDPSLALAKGAYVRFGLIEQDPTRGLMPDLAGMMPAIPGANPAHTAALMGFKPASSMAEEASKQLPVDMKSMLRERSLDPSDYKLRSFRESPDPGVTFLWMAAIKK